MTQDQTQTAQLPRGVVPYLAAADAPAALEFYRQGFGAECTMRLDMPDGKVAHAEMRMGDNTWMVGSASEEWGFPAPSGPSSVALQLQVSDCDAVVAQAVAAGARLMRPAQDQFWGARMAEIQDPAGHRWSVTQMTEQVSNDEVQRRFQAMMGGHQG